MYPDFLWQLIQAADVLISPAAETQTTKELFINITSGEKYCLLQLDELKLGVYITI